MSTPLTWHVFLSEPWPVVTTDLPPNLTHRMFPPISATLIVRSEDAGAFYWLVHRPHVSK
jgi:hypothetical protein